MKKTSKSSFAAIKSITSLKSDKTAVVKADLTVAFTKNSETDMPIKMTIDGVEYDLETYGVPYREIIIDVNGTEVETYE